MGPTRHPLLRLILVTAPVLLVWGCAKSLELDAAFEPSTHTDSDIEMSDDVGSGSDTAPDVERDTEDMDTSPRDVAHDPDCANEDCTCPDGGVWCDGTCLAAGSCCSDEDCSAGCDEMTHQCRCLATGVLGCQDGDVYYLDSCNTPIHLAEACDDGATCVEICGPDGVCEDAACAPR